jgi:hypothetical protein
VAFAFLPLEERPLDVWILNFFKSIYAPTVYLWQKQPKMPDFFSFQPAKNKPVSTKRLTPEERQRFNDYLKSLPQPASYSVLDQRETNELNQINHLLEMQTGLNPQNLLTKKTQVVKIRKLKAEPVIVRMAEPFTPPLEIGTPFKSPPPAPKPIKIPKKVKPSQELKKMTPPAIPIPAPPDIPNVLVGMVLTPEAKILAGAIIEVRDTEGMPVRASKSNKLGQFFMVTPLPNGDYEMETEYPGLSFDIIKFKAEGKIFPPVKIQAKNEMVR